MSNAPLTNQDEILRPIIRDYLAAADLWCGCQWTTNFGRWQLNLKGLHSKQTRLLAQATSGEESLGWNAATAWLEQVERDAQNARIAAAEAVDLFPNDAQSALGRINDAWNLEAKYRSPTTWEPLRSRIARSVVMSSPAAEHPDYHADGSRPSCVHEAVGS